MLPAIWSVEKRTKLMLLAALVVVLTVMLVPVASAQNACAALGLVMVWQITFNVLGHTGYEFHPPWLMESWLGKVLNTPTNHIQHHEKMKGNYGLYFNVWDRLMGTNHPDYEARFREVTSRPKGGVSNV